MKADSETDTTSGQEIGEMLVETMLSMFTAANEIVRERQIPLNYDV